MKDANKIYLTGSSKDLNWCEIQTKLIQLAGKLCDRYASDIIIDINSVQKFIDNGNESCKENFLFGFREFGVDHKAFVVSRGIDSPEYREVWELSVSKEDDACFMILERKR